MAFNVQRSGGTVRVNGDPGKTSAAAGDFISLDPNSSASLLDGSTQVAYLSTGLSSTPTFMQTVGPYAQTVYQVYYNGSYRWQINDPGNSTGIQI